MPAKTRDTLIRHYDQAQNNLDRFIETMAKMHEYYDPTHPDHALKCVEFSKVALMLKDLVDKFRREMM